MSGKRAIREAEKIAGRHGFVFLRRGKHIVWIHTVNNRRVTSPISPSDNARSFKNLEAQMRRAAADPIGHSGRH